MTLSILALIIIAVTLPISYGSVKAISSFYSLRVPKYSQMPNESRL